MATRETRHHDLEIPLPTHDWSEEDDEANEDAARQITEALEAFDWYIPKAGPRFRLPRANGSERLFLDTDGEDDPEDIADAILYVDAGEWRILKLPLGQEIETYTQWSEDEEIDGVWTFNEPIDADIRGLAEYASEVELATLAEDASAVDGKSPSEFVHQGDETEITGAWTFESRTTIERRVQTGEGTLTLPVHEADD